MSPASDLGGRATKASRTVSGESPHNPSEMLFFNCFIPLNPFPGQLVQTQL
jgi:hypothetical protein